MRLTYEQRTDRQMKEDELLSNVIQAAHLFGWRVYHVRNSRRGITQGDTGYPDLTLARLREGLRQVLFIELKRQLDEPRTDQRAWGAVLPHHYFWRPSDWRTGVVERKLREGES